MNPVNNNTSLTHQSGEWGSPKGRYHEFSNASKPDQSESYKLSFSVKHLPLLLLETEPLFKNYLIPIVWIKSIQPKPSPIQGEQKKEFEMSELTNNDAGRDEVAGTNPLTYAVAIRKAAGIKRTNDPIKLRNLRDMADAVVVGLKVSALEKTELAANTTDSLDALALKAEVVELEAQVTKMAGLKDAINARVEVLLKG